MQKENLIQSFKIFEAKKASKADGTRLTKRQIEILNKHIVGTWEMNKETDRVDITGNFYLSEPFNKTQEIDIFKGIKFGKVTGVFYCTRNFFQDLEGFPQEVQGSFNCSDNSLTSLQGGPVKIGKNFSCGNNNLKDLVGGPVEVNGQYWAFGNHLTSLAGAPVKLKGGFYSELVDIHEGNWNYLGWIEALEEAKSKNFIRIASLISTLPFLDVNFLKGYIVNNPNILVDLALFWKHPKFANFRQELENVLDPNTTKKITILNKMSGYFTTSR
jgi:hypothetical protein